MSILRTRMEKIRLQPDTTNGEIFLDRGNRSVGSLISLRLRMERVHKPQRPATWRGSAGPSEVRGAADLGCLEWGRSNQHLDNYTPAGASG